MVQLPVEWILDDAPYFEMDRLSTSRLHDSGRGHRARIAMLGRLVGYMPSGPGVWFATHEEVARYVLANRK